MGVVGVVRYDGAESVARAIEISGAFAGIRPGDRVFVKPNIVFWSTVVQMPPFGVITTTVVVEAVVRALRDLRVGQIVVAEGPVTIPPNAHGVADHAFEALGYRALARRYDLTVVNIFETPFRQVALGKGISLGFSAEFLDADAVVDLPVLKTHAQTKVSLAMKNLKGCIDPKGRKLCHSASREVDLDLHVAHLATARENVVTVMDGIYTLERGPGFSGKARRSDLIVASSDILAADMVGARLLGFEPGEVPHIAAVCALKNRGVGGAWIETRGLSIKEAASPHAWEFPYNAEGTLPAILDRRGVSGLSFPKYDHSLCTYCSGVIGGLQVALGAAWNGTPFDGVEILTGKMQAPTKGMKHTLLLGACQVRLNRHHPDIREAILVPGCPPDLRQLVAGVKKAGIAVDEAFFDQLDHAPALFMARYRDRPDFSLAHYTHTGGDLPSGGCHPTAAPPDPPNIPEEAP